MPERNVDIVRSWFPSRRVWDEEVLDWMYEHSWDPDIDWRAIQDAPDDVGRAKGSGIETELRYAVYYELRDGRAVRGREYNTKEEALAAAQEAERSEAADRSGA